MLPLVLAELLTIDGMKILLETYLKGTLMIIILLVVIFLRLIKIESICNDDNCLVMLSFFIDTDYVDYKMRLMYSVLY